jgi:hypothetical protein
MSRAQSAVRLLALVLLIGATGCAKQDFLYHRVPPQQKQRSFTHSARSVQVATKMSILWVIDNSLSMSDYQRSVITNTDRFMQRFIASRAVDWKMGLISTSEYEQPYVGLTPSTALNAATPDPVQVFQRAVQRLGTSGYGVEKTFTPILQTLRSYPDFAGKGQKLAAIVVTDAEEQSYVSGKSFLDQIKALKPEADAFALYGATAAREFGCLGGAGEGYFDYKGSPYEFVITATQGLWFKLCDPDFGTQLAAISDRILERIDHPRIYLDARPIPRTIRITYQGKELPGGPPENGGMWIYEIRSNSIVFNSLDVFTDENVNVSIEYSEDQGEPE